MTCFVTLPTQNHDPAILLMYNKVCQNKIYNEKHNIELSSVFISIIGQIANLCFLPILCNKFMVFGVPIYKLMFLHTPAGVYEG